MVEAPDILDSYISEMKRVKIISLHFKMISYYIIRFTPKLIQNLIQSQNLPQTQVDDNMHADIKSYFKIQSTTITQIEKRIRCKF